MNELLGESRSTHEAKKKLDGGFGDFVYMQRELVPNELQRENVPYGKTGGIDHY